MKPEGSIPKPKAGLQGLPASLNQTEPSWQVLADLSLAGAEDHESIANQAAVAVLEAVRSLHLASVRQTRLRTAVMRAMLNACSHGDQRSERLPISVCVLIKRNAGDRADLQAGPDQPAKHSGWGFFVIEKRTAAENGASLPVIEVFLYQEGSR